MTYVLSCNVNQPCVVGFSVVICVSNSERKASAEEKHSVTAHAEVNLHCLQSQDVVPIMNITNLYVLSVTLALSFPQNHVEVC